MDSKGISFSDQGIKDDLLKRIIESIEDAIVVINLQKIVTFCNKSTELLVDKKKTEIIGSPLFHSIHLLRKRDRIETTNFFEKALNLGQTTTPDGAHMIISSSGKELPVKVTTSPLFDPKRKILGAVIILHDLSAEQESLLLRSEFSYMQHQLGASVSGAVWNLQLALDQTLSSEVRKNLEMAKISVEEIKIITRKMFEASQLGQGLVNPVVKRINLLDILTPLLSEETTLMSEKKISLKTILPEEKVELQTDPDLLGKILRSILENARIYSPQNSEVIFQVTVTAQGLLFEAKDTGVGIPQNELSLVFSKFFRGTNAMDRPGAGLSLHIALQYTKLLKAQIWFTSKQNEGTSFSVFVPQTPI